MAILHLWFGLASALIVFLVALSGSIYAYKQPVTDLLNQQAVFTSVHSATSISTDDLVKKFEAKYGEATGVIVYDKEERNTIISSRTKGNIGITAYYCPYSGEEKGILNQGCDAFFETMLNLHRFLLLGDVGKLINGIAILIFVFLIVSGLVLWVPKTIAKLKDALRVEWRTTFYRLIYDLHNTLGFYASLLLLFMALTGLYTSFHWMKNVIIVGLGGHSIVISDDNLALQADLSKAFKATLDQLEEEAEMTCDGQYNLQSVIEETNSYFPNSGQLTIFLPSEQVKTVKITKLNFDSFLETPDVIEFSSLGGVGEIFRFVELPIHQQFKAIAKPLHTGEVFGWPGLILFSIVSLFACSLPVTGLILWLNKL